MRISSLNQKVLPDIAPGTSFRFLVTGHVYGTPVCRVPEKPGRTRVFPAASLLANIDHCNALQPAFVALLGDTVIAPVKSNKTIFRQSVAERIQSPIFHAPGNHDYFRSPRSDRQEKEKQHQRFFGPTRSWFRLADTAFVFLNTGGFDWSDFDNEQTRWARQLFRAWESDPSLENIFVFTHKLVWLPGVEALRTHILDAHPDYEQTVLSGQNYEAIGPDLRVLAQVKRVFLGAGDWLRVSRSLLYYENPEDRITYFVNYLDDSGSDVILDIEVPANGPPRFLPISLTDFEPLDLDSFVVHPEPVEPR